MKRCELGHHLQGAAHPFPMVLQIPAIQDSGPKAIPSSSRQLTRHTEQLASRKHSPAGAGSQTMAAAGLWPTKFPEPYLDSGEVPELPINVDSGQHCQYGWSQERLQWLIRADFPHHLQLRREPPADTRSTAQS